MYYHQDLTRKALFALIKQGTISVGGNLQLKIYGRLHCKSGKRMKIANRVFFGDVQEATNIGFRPCGHCMPLAYKHWKDGFI